MNQRAYILRYTVLFSFLVSALSCEQSESVINFCSSTNDSEKLEYVGARGALLASRFDDLDDLKSIAEINYYSDKTENPAGDRLSNRVVLVQCVGGKELKCELNQGINQGEILEAKEGGTLDKINLLFKSPYAIYRSNDLKNIYIYARRRYDLFGRDDVAFYDLALESVNHIKSKKSAYKNGKDSSDIGYINTFNHFTAQALITVLYDSKIAKFIADAHELDAMPELINGDFSVEQLKHPTKNPLDNYVDIINNKCGQDFGKYLKNKYQIKNYQRWDESLLSSILNDIQIYYASSFGISFYPFSKNDLVVKNFVNKINYIN